MGSDSVTIAELESWVLSGAQWRVLDISRDGAVVEMCACTGEPMQRLRTADPTVIEYLRTADSGG